MLDRRHRNGVFGLDAADSARRPDDVGAFDVRAICGQVADRHRHVDRLDDDATLPVQHAKRVGQPENVTKRGDVAEAAAMLGITDIGRTVDRTEVHHPPADVQVAFGIARMQHERAGSVRKLCFNEITADPHQLGFVIDDGAGQAEEFARRRTANLEPRLFEHAESRDENALHLFGAQDLER